MKYVISDIHGDYRHFLKILKKVGFSSSDEMFVLGDVLDKGEENLRLLQFVKREANISMIKGNHEYLCERYLDGTVSGELWDRCAGEATRREVDRLLQGEKEELYAYLSGLPVFLETEVDGEEYFLTHSGICADFQVLEKETGLVDIKASVQAAAEIDQEAYLFSDDLHYLPAKVKFNKHLVAGHFPTLFLPDWGRAEIYRGRKYMDIDTGNERRNEGGRLSCLRLDDGKEFYV